MFKYLRHLHLLIVAIAMTVFPVISYATAFPVIQPTIQPKFPTVYPSASAMPPGGGGTGSINDGKAIGAVSVGAAAAAICLSMDCTSSIATGPAGIAQPAGWPSDPSTGKPTPPATASQAPPASASTDCWTTIHGIYGANSDAYVKLTSVGFAGYINGQPYYSCTVVSNNVTNTWYTTPGTSAAPSCPAGYTASGSSCNLSSPADVQKPDGTPCQVMTDGGSVRWDTSNPACASHGAGPYWTDSDGNKESMNNGTFSVVSSDGNNKTNIGPAAANSTPVIQKLIGNGTDGLQHTFVTNTTLDSNGNVTKQTYTIDGKPVTQTEYTKTIAGTPPTTTIEQSPANTNVNVSTPAQTVTCNDVGTCGVAQETTQTGILSMITSIYKWLTGATDLSTTAQPDYNPQQNDTSLLGGIALPSLDLSWLSRIFPQPNCTDIMLDFQLSPLTHNDPMKIPICEMLPPVREALSYFWYMITAISVASILVETSPEPDMGNGKR